MQNIEGWFDGAYKDGKIGIGVVIKSNGKIIYEVSQVMEGLSNNDAEYSALIVLLEYLQTVPTTEPILIRGDSKLVINQMSGFWSIKEGAYVPKALKAKELLKTMKHVKIKWTARDNNTDADKLSKIR